MDWLDLLAVQGTLNSWDSFLLFLVCWVFLKNYEWMLNFIKCFFCISLIGHVIFILHSINLVSFINWFLFTELSLPSRNKSSCIILFIFCWIWFAAFLLRAFESMFIKGISLYVSVFHSVLVWLSQTGKGVHQGCILSPCLLNLYAEYIMWNARLDEAQAGIKIARRNINNFRYADDTTLVAESEEN